MLWRMRSCCGLRLRTGVVLIAALDMIHSILLWYSWRVIPILSGKWDLEPTYVRILIGAFVGTATEKEKLLEDYHAALDVEMKVHKILVIIFWIACVRLGFSLFMLCGNINGDKSLMKPYVYMTATLIVTTDLCMLLLIINLAYTNFVKQAVFLLFAALIWTAETLFYWQVVRSRIMEIDDEEAALDERIATMLSGTMKATV